MASVSVSHIILFIAAVGVAAVVASTATGVADDVSDALRDAGADLGEELDADVSIVSDPGSNAIYNDSTTTVTLLVKNTGARVLPTDPELVDVLVDGRLVEESNITVVDGEFWRPGNVARITLNASLSTGPHRVVVRADERRSFLLFSYYGESGTGGDTVFAGSLNVISEDGGQVTTYLSQTPQVIGPATVDFDGDGSPGAPFVNSSGTLKVVDADSTMPLQGQPPTSTSKLAVGNWSNGGPYVFFANASGIYRVAPNDAPVRIVSEGGNAVAGVADFDSDSATELVFLGSSNNVHFIDPDGTITDTQVTVGSDAGSIGAPADFDGDGRARTPYADSSNNIKLTGYENGAATTTTFTNPNAMKTGVGPHDVDGDGQLDVVYVSTNGYLKYMNLDGSTAYMHNASGSRITAESPGVA